LKRIKFDDFVQKYHTDLAAFRDRYKTEQDCIERLMEWKWPDGFVCGNCENEDAYEPYKNRHLFQCKACGYQESPTANTIFEKTRTPLKIWFLFIFCLYITKRKITTMGLMKAMQAFSDYNEYSNYSNVWKISNKIKVNLRKSKRLEKLVKFEYKGKNDISLSYDKESYLVNRIFTLVRNKSYSFKRVAMIFNRDEVQTLDCRGAWTKEAVEKIYRQIEEAYFKEDEECFGDKSV
jgi:hypothetical protein